MSKLTALEILGLNIPAEDRIYMVLHPDVMSIENIKMFACDCAERAVEKERKHGEPETSLEAIRVARRYIKGAIEDVEDVKRAADAAAYAGADSDAAFAAAYAADAAANAARAVARAADAAAYAASAVADACAAGYDAAHDAERECQLEILRHYLLRD